jgi:hypothetical protein
MRFAVVLADSLLLNLFFCHFLSPAAADPTAAFDVFVYGSTPSGIIAAVASAWHLKSC